jgi:ATP-dependent helicase/nuclease subunit A
MSSLGDYAECPKRFRLRHIDGHPGLTEGGTQAREIGSLAHLALELDIATPGGLGPFAEGASEAVKHEAAELAAAFGKSKAFSEFRVENVVREKAAEVVIEGITLVGKADLVGPEWVLDFKTDSEIEPERHMLQLAAYAEALSKPRAVVAYLRHDQVYEYPPSELAKASASLRDVVDGIQHGRFEPVPSARACGRCDFSIVCRERHGGTGNS